MQGLECQIAQNILCCISNCSMDHKDQKVNYVKSIHASFQISCIGFKFSTCSDFNEHGLNLFIFNKS